MKGRRRTIKESILKTIVPIYDETITLDAPDLIQNV
jgi:hypothetical protein